VAWDKHRIQLEAYYKEYGHCSVPLDHPKYPSLGNWLKQQRRLYKRVKEGIPESQLPEERVLALEALEFDWRSSKRLDDDRKTKTSGKKIKKQPPLVVTKKHHHRPLQAAARSFYSDKLPLKKRRRIAEV